MHDPVLSPRWVARLSAVLLGWNIALISAFLFVIATLVLLRKTGVSFQVRDVGAWFVAGFCILLAAFVGVVVGKIAYPWFQKRSQGFGYVLLLILILVSLFAFPAPFTYVL
jgi:chromate transport protein ChrA